jgi:hypothetical protein
MHPKTATNLYLSWFSITTHDRVQESSLLSSFSWSWKVRCKWLDVKQRFLSTAFLNRTTHTPTYVVPISWNLCGAPAQIQTISNNQPVLCTKNMNMSNIHNLPIDLFFLTCNWQRRENIFNTYEWPHQNLFADYWEIWILVARKV